MKPLFKFDKDFVHLTTFEFRPIYGSTIGLCYKRVVINPQFAQIHTGIPRFSCRCIGVWIVTHKHPTQLRKDISRVSHVHNLCHFILPISSKCRLVRWVIVTISNGKVGFVPIRKYTRYVPHISLSHAEPFLIGCATMSSTIGRIKCTCLVTNEHFSQTVKVLRYARYVVVSTFGLSQWIDIWWQYGSFATILSYLKGWYHQCQFGILNQMFLDKVLM
mmetsp:Transcript_15617/g.22250  ORF Transcript_15617/g.22250 Transcript_15617/m.22250 type:complete len:218 (-) Transcript_15617:337-990(-)